MVPLAEMIDNGASESYAKLRCSSLLIVLGTRQSDDPEFRATADGFLGLAEEIYLDALSSYQIEHDLTAEAARDQVISEMRSTIDDYERKIGELKPDGKSFVEDNLFLSDIAICKKFKNNML